MKIYLAIGLICLLSISAFSRVAKRDDNGIPASIIQDASGNFVIITADGWMQVVSSTTLTGGLIDRILNPVTTYLTISQLEELTQHSTFYLTVSQFRELTQNSTFYLTESQFSELNESIDEIYNQLKSSVTTADWRFANKVSTGTDGKIFASGNISPPNYVDKAFFLSEGGNVQITTTFRSGIVYVREGIPTGIPIVNPVYSPTFQCTLPSETTLYFIISEVK